MANKSGNIKQTSGGKFTAHAAPAVRPASSGVKPAKPSTVKQGGKGSKGGTKGGHSVTIRK